MQRVTLRGLVYGSLQAGRARSFPIETVYYPGIPKFQRNAEFYNALFTINARLLGDETGSMEYDFVKCASRISSRSVRSVPLFAGATVQHGSSSFEVLWPPQVLTEKKALADVRRAIEDFEAALDADPMLRRLHERVLGEESFQQLSTRNVRKNIARERTDRETSDVVRSPHERRGLSASTKRANKSLRDAANHLSLALCHDRSLVFFGDLEKPEIWQVVDELLKRSRTRFVFLVAPHHGTHWHPKLENLRCEFSISSCGPKLSGKFAPGFKAISRRSLATFANGDLHIEPPQPEWI